MELIEYTLRALAHTIADPTLALVLLLLGIFFYRKNRKIAIMQKLMIGERFLSPLELTLSQLVIGILGGCVASVILTLLGIMFNDPSGIQLLFLISFFLMLMKPRYICFSYSGAVLGMVAVISNLIGYKTVISIDIFSLLMLIGVLHAIEGILIAIDGSRAAVPVFSEKKGRLVGGFALERYWPLPLVIFIVLNNNLMVSGDAIASPSWWPLLKNGNIALLATSVLSAMPIYGVLGYKSITFTKDKRKKALTSGMYTFVYGLILIAVAQFTKFGLAFEFLALIFMPLAHEGMLWIQVYFENKGTAKYMSDEEGLTILDVVPNSIAYKNGIKSGDKILAINGEEIEEYTMLYDFLSKGLKELTLKVKDRHGSIRDVLLNIPNGSRRIGVIVIPKTVPKDDSIVEISEKRFRDILNKLKNKDKDK